MNKQTETQGFLLFTAFTWEKIFNFTENMFFLFEAALLAVCDKEFPINADRFISQKRMTRI